MSSSSTFPVEYGPGGWQWSDGSRRPRRKWGAALPWPKKLGDQLLMTDQFTARRADIALGLGRREEARALAQQAVEISRTTGGIWAEAHARRAMARILATDSPPDFDGAEAQLARSL